MKLKSSCTNSSNFFMKNRRMFLDSCVLNELATNQEVEALIAEAGHIYSTFISAVSLLEVGFGPTNKADERQRRQVIDLYTNEKVEKVNTESIDLKDPIQSRKSGKKFLYIPVEHEWYGARHKLTAWMDDEDAGGSSARKHANDALIFMCAWNANSFLVTENTKDFSRFNKIMFKETSGHLPIFTIDDLRKSKEKEVVFPSNVPNYP